MVVARLVNCTRANRWAARSCSETKQPAGASRMGSLGGVGAGSGPRRGGGGAGGAGDAVDRELFEELLAGDVEQLDSLAGGKGHCTIFTCGNCARYL
jgi:hypothetical protein